MADFYRKENGEIDREKVIDELERDLVREPDEQTHIICTFDREAVECALELLKAAYPEPHLLTRDELYEVKPGTVLWKDHRKDPDDAGTWFPITPVYFVEIKQMALFDGWDEEDVICFADEFERVSDYGAYEVYWTARPSEEQRKEAEWE